MRALIAFVGLISLHAAWAQDACETRCNQLASECLKACVGATKDAAKPDHGPRMMTCLRSCEEKAAPCRAECKK